MPTAPPSSAVTAGSIWMGPMPGRPLISRSRTTAGQTERLIARTDTGLSTSPARCGRAQHGRAVCAGRVELARDYPRRRYLGRRGHHPRRVRCCRTSRRGRPGRRCEQPAEPVIVRDVQRQRHRRDPAPGGVMHPMHGISTPHRGDRRRRFPARDPADPKTGPKSSRAMRLAHGVTIGSSGARAAISGGLVRAAAARAPDLALVGKQRGQPFRRRAALLLTFR